MKLSNGYKGSVETGAHDFWLWAPGREKLTFWMTFVRLDLLIVRQIWGSNHVGLIFFLHMTIAKMNVLD